MVTYIAFLRAEGLIDGGQGKKSHCQCFLIWNGTGVFAMSWSERRGQPVIFYAVLKTLCRAFLLAAEKPAYQTVSQRVKMLSITER